MKKNIIIIILSILVISLAGYIVYDKVTDKKEEPVKNDINNTEPIKTVEHHAEKSIELSNKTEKLKFDDTLSIEFIGAEEYTDMYRYTAKIFIDGKLVENTLFGNVDNKSIWSNNYAANFKVVRVDTVYFIISSISKQQDGDYILIVNNNGEIINSFTDVTIIIDKDNKSFDISDCVTGAVDEECIKTTYSIK